MTTVVAIQGNDFAVISADSRISSMDEGGYTMQINNPSNSFSKITQTGPYLIGMAGDIRGINLVAHAFTPPTPPSRVNLDKFITTKFVPELKNCFEENGYHAGPSTTDKTSAHHSSTLLIAIRSQIYLIDEDYSWITQDTGLYAIGTGAEYALGALTALITAQGYENPKTAQQITKKTLQIVAQHDPHTGPPYKTNTQTR